MKYERFEQLPVWQVAIDLAQRVFRLTDDRSFRLKGDLANQLERAALSISNNVAEGFEPGTTAELLTFLYYARGSAGEVRSMLHLCERLPYFDGPKREISNPKSEISNLRSEGSNRKSEISDLRSEISNLKSMAESISRQIRGWADSLQNSDIKGQRHLNDDTRREYDRQNRAAAFWRQLDEFRNAAPSHAPTEHTD